MSREYILKLSCPDTVGIVAAVSVFLSKHNCNIKDSAQFGDQETELFFMRVYFRAEDGAPSHEGLRAAFAGIAANYQMNWGIYGTEEKCRVAIMVSQHGHCLNDLLYRYRTGVLDVKIVAVISNHPDFKDITEWHGIPFHYLPVSSKNRAEQESAILEILEDQKTDLVILARYANSVRKSMP